jgi:hypothetical protein
MRERKAMHQRIFFARIEYPLRCLPKSIDRLGHRIWLLVKDCKLQLRKKMEHQNKDEGEINKRRKERKKGKARK